MPLPPRKRLRSLWTEGAAFFTSPFPFLRPPPAGVAAGTGAAAVVDALDDLQALAERFVWKTLTLKASVLYLLLFEKSRLLNRLFCFHRRFKIILLEKD